MIPKRIHYCWFGGGKMPKMIRECITTWHQHMPDWEYVLWDEKACESMPSDVGNPLLHPFVQSAYKAKMWAFVADYVRFWALYHFGGVYLDTDMYAVRSMNDLLNNTFFTGWEDQNQSHINCACFGAEKKDSICKTIMSQYDGLRYSGQAQSELVIPNIITPIILRFKSEIAIYPSDYFYPYSYENRQIGVQDFKHTISANTYAVHLWNISWSSWPQKALSRISYRILSISKIRKKPTIVHFVDYRPTLYSGMDRWLVLLGEKLQSKGYQPVYVYVGDIQEVPELAQALNKTGIILELLPRDSKASQILSSIRILTKYRPVIVHSHFMNHIKWWLAVMRPFFGYNYYVSWHGLIYEGGWEQYRKANTVLKAWIYKNVFCGLIDNSASKVICVSRAVENQWNSFQSNGKSKTIYLGIKPCQYLSTKENLRNQLEIPQNEMALVNVSAIEELKGIDLIIKAIARLKAEGIKCHFYHIGSLRANTPDQIKYYETLKRLTQDLQVDEMITWMGKRQDVQQILPVFDIYIHPSREEGIGMANIEAAAAGLPIIGSNVGGIPEVVKNGENGFLISNEDVRDLANRIKILLTKEDLRIQFSKESKQIAEKDFDINGQTDKLIKLYLE